MKIIELQSSNSPDCLLIFDGFGGSKERAKAINLLPSNCSCYFIYDYTNDSFDLDLSRFSQIKVIAWSLGVWQAAVTLAEVKLSSAIAMNGTLQPIDAEYGIAPEMFQSTIDHWCEVARRKFERRIGVPDSAFSSTRLIEDEKAELQALQTRVKTTPVPKNIYDLVFISNKDKIFSCENQINSWKQINIEYQVVEAPHYLYNCLESLVNFG